MRMSNETPTVSSPSALKTYSVYVMVGQLISDVAFMDEIQATSEEEAQEKVAEILRNVDIGRIMRNDPRFSIADEHDTYFDERSVEPSDVSASCDEE